MKKMFIDGRWTEGTSGKVMQIINPATGEAFEEMHISSIDDVRAAIAAAKKSFY